MDWFQIGKGVGQGYSYFVTLLFYLTCRVNHVKDKLELRLLEEISITSGMQMILS